MKTLFLSMIVALAMAATKRTKPTLATSCPCDSSQVVAWGDGTYRSMVVIGGTGYQPDTIIRVTWSLGGTELWTFDCLTDSAGAFSEVWTDVPAGVFAITASQPKNRVRFEALATTQVEVL